ncbi:hypothetical protein PMZ80_006899 [Knufia obscura]|uniref:Uncharacterized protein n=2 Tax=Knufia TaxID=430999 RepID=A0AAN8IAZ9_9EURO|nr:hypothetical protein PMZ80_006899 [Knufia obscura]KAK5957441.1 hypothetical protein OHC33_001815 [Knufia fluminis]
MASNVGDRILWTAVIASSIAAYWFIPSSLYHVKDLAVVSAPKPKPTKPQLINDAEAAIKPSTIAELASGPSYPIASSAIRLAAKRFVKDAQARRQFMLDLQSKEWHRRDRALNVLQLLLQNPALKESRMRQHFLDNSTFSALVAALVNLLPEHKRNTVIRSTRSTSFSPIRPLNRPAHERKILEVVLLLLEEPRDYNLGYSIVNAQPAIDAGIVTKWLKHYPFPCTLPEYRKYNFKRRDVVKLLDPDVWGDDDELMSRLMQMLIKMPHGARQLADVGFRTSSIHDRSNVGSRQWAVRSHPPVFSLDERPEYISIDGEEDDENNVGERAGELIDDEELMTRLQDPQARDGTSRSAGEMSRQRRHRQAVVVAEAGVPLGPDSILQRQPTQTELNWEQEVQGRQGELLRSSSRRSASAEESAADQIARERIDGLEGASRTPFQPPALDELEVPEEFRPSEQGREYQEDAVDG